MLFTKKRKKDGKADPLVLPANAAALPQETGTQAVATTSPPDNASTPALAQGSVKVTSVVENTSARLVHPVYLDVPMMASFYASEGMTINLDSVATAANDTGTTLEAKAEVKVAFPLLSALSPLSAGAAGNISRQTRSQESVETRSVYQHTESSLLNLLRRALIDSELLCALDALGGTPERVLQLGDLLQISGRIIGNPLEKLLETYDRLLPYAGLTGEPPKAKSEPPRKLFWPLASQKVSRMVDNLLSEDRNRPKLVRILREDLEKSYVRDLVLECREIPAIPVILVVSTEFFTSKAVDYLVDGEFTVIGKVTGLADPGASVDLMRRTALATMSTEKVHTLVAQLSSDVEALGAASFSSPSVTHLAGSLQLLPLAIFV